MREQGYTIGLDCRFGKTHSGIGRYTRELKKHLQSRNDSYEYLFLEPDIPYYSLAEQLKMPRIIKDAGVDLLHVPHFNVPFFPPACPTKRGARRRVPFVITIHDLTLHHYPNEASFAKRTAYHILMRRAVTKAKHIIAVSTYTAEEIAKFYGEKVREKITVIYEGVSPNFHPRSEDEKKQLLESYNLPTDFLLYVGASKEHKNVQALIDACPENRTLVLVTGGKEAKHLTLRPNVRILENIEDDTLPIFYSAASCFVFPSLAEGFGLPALEAMACGCPVVASNRTSLPEICGEHAILTEPTEEGLAEGIERALKEPPNIEAAIKHARSFSWERMVEETVEVYKKIGGLTV